jgi:methyl-accepting chemotaxis protein
VTHPIPEWILLAFVVITGIGVLLQAVAMLGILFALNKALKQAKEATAMAEDHVVPAMTAAKRLLEEVGPKVKVAAENAVTLSRKAIAISDHAAEASLNVVEITGTLRKQSEHVSETVNDLLKRTEAQAERVDEMMTGTLDTIAHATATWQRAVGGPFRQVTAVLNGLRAGFDVLRGRGREAHAAADGEHFV